MAQFDADQQFFAEDLPALSNPVLEGRVDMCVGSRFLSTAADQQAYEPIWSRDVGNRILALYTSALVGRRLTDVTTGMKAWNRSSINLIDLQDDAYSYEVELVIRAIRTGARVMEIPVSYASRTAGESMHRSRKALARAGLRIMAHAFATRFRPL